MRRLALAALVLVGCDQEPAWECIVPDGADPDWTRKIGCDADYALLWDDRNDAIFAHTSTINWLIDREDGDRVYFIDTRTFDLHYFFAAQYLNLPGKTPVGTHGEFNLLNYRRPDRRFVLGKLMHYHDQGLLTIEFSAGDTADADMIVFAYELIAASIFDGDELRYRPVSAYHETLLPQLEGRVPIVRTEDVFAGQTYQPLNQKVGYGTLVFRRVAELSGRPLLPTEIVVLDRVPNDIPMVSGVITAEFQTPLSHVNILSKNRGTPNMAARGAFDDPALRALDGQLVRLDVGAQAWTVEPATPADAQAYWDGLRPAQPLVPVYDLTVATLQDLDALDHTAANVVGSKAANMAEMMRIVPAIPLPDAPFAVPFSYYHAHLEAHGLWQAVDELLADAPSLDPIELQERLFDLRWRIYQAPLDPAALAELVGQVRARWGDDRKIRFRSSTNAEDLPDFTGAGLYTSASGKLADGEDTLENALKVAWASAWNYQAFVEREFYRVDHREIRVGVLVHPSFTGELANGVAVTINEFAANRPAYFINSQLGDISVTNPTGFAIPEQLLYYTWYEEPEYEVITRSSLVEGAVLQDAELDVLAGHLGAIHEHWRGLLGGSGDFAMDVEFKLEPGRVIAIKQARPLRRR